MSLLDTYKSAATLYDILGIPETASTDEIKRAYYTLVRLYPGYRHPELFACLTEAGTVLTDPRRRGEYDQNRRSGKRVQVLMDQAAAALEQDNQKAVTLLKNAITIAPDVPRPRHLFAHLLMKMEEYTLAEKQYKWLIKEHPRDETLRFKLARALHAQGRLSDTEKELLRALKLNPRYHDALMLLSRVYEEARRWEWAGEALEKAIANDEAENFADFDAVLRLLTLYLQSENEAGCAQTLTRLLSIVPLAKEEGDTRNGDRSARKMVVLASEFFEKEKYAVAAGILEAARQIPEAIVGKGLREEIATQAFLVTLTAEAQHTIGDPLLPAVLKDVFHLKYLDKTTDTTRRGRLDIVQTTLQGEIQRDARGMVNAIEYIRREYPNLATDQGALLQELQNRAARRIELLGPAETGPGKPAVMPGTNGTAPAVSSPPPAPKRKGLFKFFGGKRDDGAAR